MQGCQISTLTCHIDRESVVQSLLVLSNPTSTSQQTKEANSYLLECQRTSFSFLAVLLEVFENNQHPVVRLQSLLYFNNILKRNWNNKRQNRNSPNFQSDKAVIKQRLVDHLRKCEPSCLSSLLDVVVFISKYEFPHNFEPLNAFIRETYRAINQGVAGQPLALNYLRSIRKVFKEQLSKKSFVSKKVFQQVSMPVLGEAFQLFNGYGERLQNPNSLSQVDWRMMRSNLKVLLAEIATAPPEILELEEIPKLMTIVQGQLQLIAQALASGGCNQQSRDQAEKTLKSFLQYLGHVQQSHSFVLAGTLKQLIVVLTYIFLNHKLFHNMGILRFAISLFNRILKCFNYYSDDAQFLASHHSRQNKSLQYDQLHKMCRQTYFEVFTQPAIENLLGHALTNILSIRQHELEVGSGVEEEDNKIDDRDNTIFNITMFLVDTIFVRFVPFSLTLFNNLLTNSAEKSFTGLDDATLNNLFAVLSIVPKACRTGQLQQFKRNVPIAATIQFIHSTGKFKDKFALLCCKWLDSFGAAEIKSILEVLLQYLENEQRVETILECCLAVKTIILARPDHVDLGFAVQKILPVAISLCSYVDSTQVLWPMLTLITKIISKVEGVNLNHELLHKVFSGPELNNLLAVKTQLIVEALCEMIRSLLCVFPRNLPVPSIFSLAINFLDNHLGDTYMACFPSVLAVWYVTVREYNLPQGLNDRMVYLFERYFSKLVGTQQQQLLYVLEEYVLLGLIPSNLATFLTLLNDFYSDQPEDKEEVVALKTAVLSVHITFITKFGVQQAHSNELLVKYLADMNTPDTVKNKSVSALRNSLLTLVNRYLILFKEGFLSFVSSIGLNRATFVQVWLAHMEHLTSRNACKINAIALLNCINDLDPSTLNLEQLFKLIVPEVESYLKNLQQDNVPFFGGIAVSPSNRLHENVLSQRKQEVRRVGVFEDVNLRLLYRTEIGNFVTKFGLTPHLLQPQFLDKSLVGKIFMLLA